MTVIIVAGVFVLFGQIEPAPATSVCTESVHALNGTYSPHVEVTCPIGARADFTMLPERDRFTVVTCRCGKSR